MQDSDELTKEQFEWLDLQVIPSGKKWSAIKETIRKEKEAREQVCRVCVIIEVNGV